MMIDPVLVAFLKQQHKQAMELVRRSPVMEIVPVDGSPPNKYAIEFRARGLVREPGGEIGFSDRCTIGLWMPENYLRDDWDEVRMPILTYLGPHPVPWHPNISIKPGQPHFVCVHVRPGTPLVQLVQGAYEIWTWKLYYTGDDGLNPEASAWARRQDRARFPVDKRPLVGRTGTPRMKVRMKKVEEVETTVPEGGG